MRRILLPAILLVVIILISLFTSHAAENPKFEKWKKPSYFRGVNVTNIHIKIQNDFDDLKAAGANLVQIGTLGFQHVYPPYAANEASAASTDAIVEYCRKAGLHYTIALRQGAGRRDVSGENAETKSSIWTNAEEQKAYAEMVKGVAQRYSGDSLFVGINVFMEPNPLFDVLHLKPELLQNSLNVAGISMDRLYQQMIDAVRTVDAELPIIVQSVSYSSPEFFKLVTLVNDPYAVYEFHSYRPSEFVKNSTPNSAAYPGSYFSLPDFGYKLYNKKYLANSMYQQVLEVQKKTGAPIFLGEFGMMHPQNGGVQLLKEVSEIALEHNWHFAYWDYRNGVKEWNIEELGSEYWAMAQESFMRPTSAIVADAEEESIAPKTDLSITLNSISRDFVQFSVDLQHSALLKAELYSITGERLHNISVESKAGANSVSFATENLQTGIYFIRVTNGLSQNCQKFILTN